MQQALNCYDVTGIAAAVRAISTSSISASRLIGLHLEEPRRQRVVIGSLNAVGLLVTRTIGASGRPDPKRLFKDGVWYRLEKKKASDEVSASEGDEQKPVEPSSE